MKLNVPSSDADDVGADVELGPNAACKTINHEIENAADVVRWEQGDFEWQSYAKQALAQAEAAVRGIFSSCDHLFHFCGQKGARKCQSVRVPHRRKKKL